MTRRDIIIIAVLSNIAVLAVMFLLAFRPEEDDQVEEQPEIAYTLVEDHPESTLKPEVIKLEPADEVDTVIEDVTPINMTQSVTADDENIQYDDMDPIPKPTYASLNTSAVDVNRNTVDVTIKKGDVLEKIARANGTTVEAIMKVNNLKSDRLKIGQVLHIPLNTNKAANNNSRTSSAKAETQKPIALQEIQIQYYTIKSGDNPWKIAKQFNVKVDELLQLNDLDEESARKLKAGDQIRIR